MLYQYIQFDHVLLFVNRPKSKYYRLALIVIVIMIIRVNQMGAIFFGPPCNWTSHRQKAVGRLPSGRKQIVE